MKNLLNYGKDEVVIRQVFDGYVEFYSQSDSRNNILKIELFEDIFGFTPIEKDKQ